MLRIVTFLQMACKNVINDQLNSVQDAPSLIILSLRGKFNRRISHIGPLNMRNKLDFMADTVRARARDMILCSCAHVLRFTTNKMWLCCTTQQENIYLYFFFMYTFLSLAARTDDSFTLKLLCSSHENSYKIHIMNTVYIILTLWH